MSIYMKFGSTQGSSTRANYKDWITLHSTDFIMRRNLGYTLGNPCNRTTGLPSFSELEITKNLDSASNDMFTQFCQSGNTETVEIHVCSNNADSSPYLKYILSNVMISEGHRAATNHGLPLESWRLSYTKLQTTYIGLDASNKPKSPHSVGYDLEKIDMM